MALRTQTTYKPRTGGGYNVSYTETAGTATAVTAGIGVVRLVTSSDAYINTQTTATSANGMLMIAGIPEYISVNTGTVISVVQSTVGGTMNVVEMDQ